MKASIPPTPNPDSEPPVPLPTTPLPGMYGAPPGPIGAPKGALPAKPAKPPKQQRALIPTNPKHEPKGEVPSPTTPLPSTYSTPTGPTGVPTGALQVSGGKAGGDRKLAAAVVAAAVAAAAAAPPEPVVRALDGQDVSAGIDVDGPSGLRLPTGGFQLPGLARRPTSLPEVGDSTRVDRRSSASLPVSSFDAEPRIDLQAPRTRWWIWLSLGLAAAVLSQGFAWWFFSSADTFGGALMFAIAGLAGFIYPLFQRNAKEIWAHQFRPRTANLLLLGDLLLLFSGLIAGFMAVPLVIGMETYHTIFSGITRFIDLRRASLASFDFAGTPDLILVNLRVAVVFFLVGLLTRYVGTLIVVVWNAATWGVVFAAGITGGLTGEAISGAAKWSAGLQLAAVALPHLMVETVAYLCTAMAGIFLSRAAQRYRWTGERFAMVAQAVLWLLLAALVLVVLAALLEGVWGRWLASLWFKPWQAID